MFHIDKTSDVTVNSSIKLHNCSYTKLLIKGALPFIAFTLAGLTKYD